jgi:hypothetical protein
LCDLQVEGASDLPTFDAVETVPDSRNSSFLVGYVTSGLRMDFLSFETHFKVLIGHWHGLADQCTRGYAPPN